MEKWHAQAERARLQSLLDARPTVGARRPKTGDADWSAKPRLIELIKSGRGLHASMS